MSIADDITREVIFTDYNIRETDRHEVAVLALHDGRPVARLRRCEWVHSETDEPDMLRSLAACLNAAADEMERAARG